MDKKGVCSTNTDPLCRAIVMVWLWHGWLRCLAHSKKASDTHMCGMITMAILNRDAADSSEQIIH